MGVNWLMVSMWLMILTISFTIWYYLIKLIYRRIDSFIYPPRSALNGGEGTYFRTFVDFPEIAR